MYFMEIVPGEVLTDALYSTSAPTIDIYSRANI